MFFIESKIQPFGQTIFHKFYRISLVIFRIILSMSIFKVLSLYKAGGPKEVYVPKRLTFQETLPRHFLTSRIIFRRLLHLHDFFTVPGQIGLASNCLQRALHHNSIRTILKKSKSENLKSKWKEKTGFK